MPKRAKVGNRNTSVEIDTATYFLGVRMEQAGILNKGQALMLAATLKKPQGEKAPKKGKRV